MHLCMCTNIHTFIKNAFGIWEGSSLRFYLLTKIKYSRIHFVEVSHNTLEYFPPPSGAMFHFFLQHRLSKLPKNWSWELTIFRFNGCNNYFFQPGNRKLLIYSFTAAFIMVMQYLTSPTLTLIFQGLKKAGGQEWTMHDFAIQVILDLQSVT